MSKERLTALHNMLNSLYDQILDDAGFTPETGYPEFVETLTSAKEEMAEYIKDMPD